MRQQVFFVAAALVATSCANQKSSHFTSIDELKKVLEQPKPTRLFDESSISVDRWELEGALPTQYAEAPHETQSAIAPAFIAAAASRGFVASDPLACVARQMSRFHVLQKGSPSEALRFFIFARCGVPSAQVSTRFLTGEVPAAMTDAEIVGQWKGQLAKLAEDVPAGARAGIGWWREGASVAVTVATLGERTELEPVTMTPDGEGFVWVRGTTRRTASEIFGAANQGASGFAECVNTQARAAPSFELKCPVSKDDETAWITIAAREKGRVLGLEIVRLLALPSGAKGATYQRPTLVTGTAGTTPADFLSQLNEVRAKLGRTPLTLSEAQSSDHRELLPFYLEAADRQDGAMEDKIALGAMAGWRVETEIMRGTFGAGSAEATSTAALLAQLLDRPGYRRDLLAPRAGVLAVGLLQESRWIAAAVSTYETVQAPKWPDTANTLLNSLNGRRARNGKKPVQWVLMPSSVEANYAEAVATKKYDSNEALERFMSSAVEITRRPVRGFLFGALELDDVEWPVEMLSKDDVEVMITVTTERLKGEPWSQYVVLLVILGGATQPTT